jgi:hypothetical protein
VAFQYLGSLSDYQIKPNVNGGFNLWRFKDWSAGGWVVVCRGTREALGLELLKRFGLEPEPDEPGLWLSPDVWVVSIGHWP